jgi:NIMA (never in mitosis gene a)-related kinase 1/4/5
VKRKVDSKLYAIKKVKIVEIEEKDKVSATNEVRILASINHNNVISYREAFMDNS